MSSVYFFLDHPDHGLSTSIDLFNMPSTRLISGYKPQKKYIHAFYTYEDSWNIKLIDTIEPGSIRVLKKEELPYIFRDKSVFVTLSDRELLNLEKGSLSSVSYEPYPPWRANIKITSKYMGTSYQGEVPEAFLDMKLSLISCSPMFQYNKEVENFFYLINLNRCPKQISFELDILSVDKRILATLDCKTNAINLFNLNDILPNTFDKLLIFRSKEFGGIPLYFSKNIKNSSLSLEHTHPPIEQVYLGNRYVFQKRKKSHWFK